MIQLPQCNGRIKKIKNIFWNVKTCKKIVIIFKKIWFKKGTFIKNQIYSSKKLQA